MQFDELLGTKWSIPRVAGVPLTMTDASLAIRLSRDLWQLERRHVALARTVSAVARAHGAAPDRAAVQEVQLAIAAKRDVIDLGFWRAVLGYAPMADDNAVELLGTDRRSGCRSSTRPSRCGTRCISTCRSRASTSRDACRRH